MNNEIYNRNTRVKLFTDSDLDGIGSAIVAKYFFANLDITFCTYSTLIKDIEKFFSDKENLKNYDMILFTDLSINEPENVSLAEIINKYRFTHHIEWLDHHETSEWLNIYDWGTVIQEDKGIEQCGCSLLLDKLTVLRPKENPTLCKFVELVRLYDTYEWYRRDMQAPKDLDTICKFYNREYFMNMILTKILVDNGQFLGKRERVIIETIKEKENMKIIKKLQEVKTIEIDGLNWGYVFNSDYEITSLLGNMICKNERINCDLAAIIYETGVALRSIGDKVNVGKIAEKFGGRGRQNTAGFKFEKDFSIDDLILERILKQEKILKDYGVNQND